MKLGWMMSGSVQRRCWGVVFALALAAPGPVWAEAKITFNLKEADIGTVVATVSDFTGKNFIVDPRVKGKVTIISARPMNKDEVYQTFLSLLEVHNFAAVRTGNIIKIVPDVNAKQSAGNVSGVDNPGEGDEIVTQVIEVKHVSAAQLVPILRPLVPQQGHMAAYAPTNVLIVSDRAANLKRLLQIIERIDIASATDIEVYRLKYASAAEVVRIIEMLNRQGQRPGDPGAPSEVPVLVADERTNSILMGGDKSSRLSARALITHLDTPMESSGNTHVVYLHYAKAKELTPVLTGLGDTYEKEKKGGAVGAAPSPGAGAPGARAPITIQPHEATNALVITAPPDLFRELESVIKKLDVRRAQVLVEAVIAEISNNRMKELGVQWIADGTPGGNGPVGGTNFGSNNILKLGAAVRGNTVPEITPGALLGIGRFNSKNVNFGVLINALESDGDSNVLSKPTIVTLDNEEAEIIVGQNVPFITGSYSGTGNSTTPQNPFQTIKRENVGITLKVKPQINEGDAIKLDIEQKVDALVQSSLPASDLITSTRSIKTSVLVDDGGAIVLGGLTTDDLKESVQKVPILGDIPLIGALFRYKKTTKEKTNLMVFIRPVIMRDAAVTTRMTAGKYNYIRGQQVTARERGVGLMDDKEAPVMPELQEFVELPPPFELVNPIPRRKPQPETTPAPLPEPAPAGDDSPSEPEAVFQEFNGQ
ncbi:MAG: type II secretion system secretin GspD [Gammaproteobacteria bacterium]|nr:type II secretion system secretin GspD [Gammaproteobacteria bacterium]